MTINHKISHSIENQLPSHVVENYPHFVEFIKSYYTWLESNNQPAEVIAKHLDWLSFKESVDEYVLHIKNEYLANIPQSVLLDKEMFINWSKHFNISRGSKDSFKFLFKILFNEDIEMYTPKNDILKLSDGRWNDTEYLMYLTYSDNYESLLYSRVYQKRHIVDDIYEYSYATVQRVSVVYAGRYKVVQVYLSDIDGTFKENVPILNDVNDEVHHMFPVSASYNVISAGTYYAIKDTLTDILPSTFDITRSVASAGYVDTKLTTTLTAAEIGVSVNGIELAVDDYTYDGRYIFHSALEVNDVVIITLPTYTGEIHVETVNNLGGIVTVEFSDLYIGLQEGEAITLTNTTGDGTGGIVEIYSGCFKKVAGYYTSDYGQLSSTKKLQDSYYYQTYSYAIKTENDISKYRDIVLKLLHPSGMKMFGIVNIQEFIEMFIKVDDFTIRFLPYIVNIYPKHAMGNNIASIWRIKDKLDPACYKPTSLDSIDTQMASGYFGTKDIYGPYIMDGYIDPQYINGIYEKTVNIQLYKYYDTDIVKTSLIDPNEKSRLTTEDYTGWLTRNYMIDESITISQIPA